MAFVTLSFAFFSRLPDHSCSVPARYIGFFLSSPALNTSPLRSNEFFSLFLISGHLGFFFSPKMSQQSLLVSGGRPFGRCSWKRTPPGSLTSFSPSLLDCWSRFLKVFHPRAHFLSRVTLIGTTSVFHGFFPKMGHPPLKIGFVRAQVILLDQVPRFLSFLLGRFPSR